MSPRWIFVSHVFDWCKLHQVEEEHTLQKNGIIEVFFVKSMYKSIIWNHIEHTTQMNGVVYNQQNFQKRIG